MKPIELLAEIYDTNSKAFKIPVEHGRQVAKKARLAAKKSIAEIIDNLSRYGTDKVQRFESWARMFE